MEADASLHPHSGQTGPRTDAGKARSRKNALVHGMRARTLIQELLDPAIHEATVQSLRDCFGISSALEERLINDLADLITLAGISTAALSGLLCAIEGAETADEHFSVAISKVIAGHRWELNSRYSREVRRDIERAIRLLWEAKAHRLAMAKDRDRFEAPRFDALRRDLRTEVGCLRLLAASTPTQVPIPAELPKDRHHPFLEGTFLSSTNLPISAAMVAAVELLRNPQLGLGTLRERTGIASKRALKRLVCAIRTRNQADDDRVLRFMRRRLSEP